MARLDLRSEIFFFLLQNLFDPESSNEFDRIKLTPAPDHHQSGNIVLRGPYGMLCALRLSKNDP